MSLFLSIVNACLLLFLIWQIWKRLPSTRDRNLWLVYAGLKSAAACAFVWVYSYHYGTGDMLNYIHDAEQYRGLNLQPFVLALLTDPPIEILDQLVYDFDPRAMLMAKIVALGHFLSGNIWFTALNFSIVGAVVTFRFFMVLKRSFRGIVYPAVGAFLLFPSLVFWTSGICKEAVSFPMMLLVAIPLLRLNLDHEKPAWMDWALAALGAITLWFLKYYVAAIVLPACLLYALSTSIHWTPYRKLVVGAAVYIILLLIVSQLHPNLYLSRTMQVMVDNYELTISQTQPEKAAHYEGLTANIPSFVYHFPEAVYTGLFRPVIGEQWDLPSLMVVIQNSVLLLLMIAVLVEMTIRRRWRIIPAEVWAVFGLIIILSGLLAITTPNFGTLDRYRVAYQPFLVLLILLGAQQLIASRKLL